MADERGTAGVASEERLLDGAAADFGLARRRLRPDQRRRRPTRRPRPKTEPAIDFSADQVEYDSDAEIVTASGQVRMSRDGNYLAADRVSCGAAKPARSPPKAMSSWSIPQGDKLVGERVVLTDTLRDGTIENLLVVLESGGRIAAPARDPQRRPDDPRQCGLFALPGDDRGRLPAQSQLADHRRPGDAGSARKPDPLRRRPAAAVRRDPALAADFQRRHRRRRQGGVSGCAGPRHSAFGSNNGLELAFPYYWQFAPNRDLTVTPHIYTGALPAIEAQISRSSTGSAPSRSAASSPTATSTTPT